MARKSIFKNYIFNAIYSLLGVVIPLITIPYVSRILLSEGVGQVSYAQNIASYFVLLASLGIPNYGIREIARNNTTVENRTRVFCEIFYINLIATILSTVMYYSIVMAVDFFSDKRNLYCIVGITLVLNAFNIDWFYKGIEEFKYITVRSCIIKLLAVIAIYFFVNKKEDVWKYALILTLATSANYILNIIHVRKYLTNYRQKLCPKQHIKPIIFMFTTALAVELYAQLDTTMIGIICGDRYVGYYSNAIKLIRIIAIVISAIGSVLLPRLSVYYAENKTYKIKLIVNDAIDYILYISVPCIIGIFLEADNLVHVLFGNDFIPSITTLKILAPLILILSVGNIFGTQLMMVFGLEKKLTVTVLCGAIINMILNSVFISKFQQNGAALASVIAELVVMIMQIVMTRDYIEVKLKTNSMYKLIIQSLLMIAPVIIMNKIIKSSFLALIASTMLGAITYFVTSLLLKNELALDILKRIRIFRADS